MYQGESTDEGPPITERVDKREHVQDFHPKELIRRKKNVDSKFGNLLSGCMAPAHTVTQNYTYQKSEIAHGCN